MVKFPALKAIQQVAAELGLIQPVSLSDVGDTNLQQLLALANAAGAELATYYNWQELIKEWVFDTIPSQAGYDMPADWNYFLDQTQWDRTNHWPLMGPKSATEWQWLKGGLLSQGPRIRYRVVSGKFELWPVPGSTPYNLAMEYVSTDWVTTASGTSNLINEDGDVPIFDFWMYTRFIKLKFQQIKGLDTTACLNDFTRMFGSITGKDAGAPILNLSPRFNTLLITPNNVPDGSWPVGVSTP